VIETRQILEELQLKEVVATSSTGAIFLAGNPDTGRDQVIKMVSCAVPNAEDKVRRLFLDMAEAARNAGVQAMPALTDHGLTPEGDGFLVMDHVEGRALDTFDELSPFAAVNILLDVLSCIEDLASAGTAHLNLKAANIFVTNPPSYDRAVVLGFGTSATLLHAGAGVPVPAADPHLAPELVSGEVLPADEPWRSDLFSFGVIACGALGAEIEANGYDRPRVTLPAPVRDELPEAEPLEEALGRVMAPDPALRGSSPSDIRDPLIRALPDPPAVTAPDTADPSTHAAEPFDPNRTDPAIGHDAVVAVTRATVPPESPPPTAEHDRPPEYFDVGAGDDVDGWPEVLFDDPVLPASLDETEDTDVRNPVPEDVWVPTSNGGVAIDEGPRAVRPEAEKTGSGGRRVSRTEVALVAAVVVVLVGIIAFTWPTGGDDDALAVAASVSEARPGSSESLIPPPPDDNLFDDLLAIQRLVDAGDLEAAREALDRFDSRDGLALGSDESALYDSLVTAVAQAADRGAALDDLRTGLDYGSIKMIRRGAAGLNGLSRTEIDEIRGLAGDLERARLVLRLHSEMWEASSDGDHLGAITAATDLERQLPGYSGASEVREQSAEEIEGRAGAFADSEEYESAIAVLQSLERVWPDRAGLAANLARYQEQVDLARREGSRIAAAVAMGEAGDPERGLASLAEMTPDSRLQDEYDRARSSLEAQLAEMDADAPTIEIATAIELAFKKNATITVPFKVTDDYRVERVVVHARNEADDGFLQIPLQIGDDGLYHFTVTPEIHGNRNVEFFVVARDHSGHIGRFAAQDSPQTITRKKWFKKLL
jgi:hypothetical protein